MSLVHYETRTAHARVVADVTGGKSLLPAIEEMMEAKRTHLHSDGGAGYRHIARLFARHEWVDHKGGEYARGNVSTNLNEGFHSQLKRSLDGTHPTFPWSTYSATSTSSPGSTPTARPPTRSACEPCSANVEGRRLTYKPMVARGRFLDRLRHQLCDFLKLCLE